MASFQMDGPSNLRVDQGMDWLRVKDIQQSCIVGLYPDERLKPQELHLDIELGLDLRDAGRRNRLEDTIDYAQLISFVRWLLATARFELIEHAAEVIAFGLLSLKLPSLRPYDYQRAQKVQPALVRVTLRKPSALEGCACPEIMIERRRDDVRRQQSLWQAKVPLSGSAAAVSSSFVIFDSDDLRLMCHSIGPRETFELAPCPRHRQRFVLNGHGELAVMGEPLGRKESRRIESTRPCDMVIAGEPSDPRRYVLELSYEFSSDRDL